VPLAHWPGVVPLHELLQLPQLFTSLAKFVQVPVQQVIPEAQHPAPQQYWPLAQQVEPQHCWPGGQQVAEAPVPQHPDPAVAQQVLPHTVVPGVSHTPPHRVVPAGQAQVPLWQVIPLVQTVPGHPPQLVLLVWVFTHTPPQQVGVALGQAVPQAPQLVALVCRVVHTPPQHDCPAGHTVPQAPQSPGLVWTSTQVPPQHTEGAVQVVPQVPQLVPPVPPVSRFTQVPPQQVCPAAQHTALAPAPHRAVAQTQVHPGPRTCPEGQVVATQALAEAQKVVPLGQLQVQVLWLRVWPPVQVVTQVLLPVHRVVPAGQAQVQLA